MTQELHIKETLPALSFNYEQLKQWAIGLTERYANVVVTEDAVVDVKRDMAELNKNKAFSMLWDETNNTILGPSWRSNPWVWVVIYDNPLWKGQGRFSHV